MNEYKIFDDDDFKDFDIERVHYKHFEMSVQQVMVIAGGVFLVLVLLGLCCRCCRRQSRGQILSPAPVVQVTSHTAVPYPQQQYVAPYPAQIVTTYPTQATTTHMYATPYPPAGPRSESMAPYPQSSYPAPYPAANTAPYPHPSAQPGGPYPMAPSAPDANALPPSYEQAVCAKQPAHNPHATH